MVSKGRDKRPQFNALIKDANSRRFDLIACWSVDRLGRSLRDLVDFLAEIHAKKVGLYLHQQGGRYLHAWWEGTVPDGWRVRGVRAVHDRGTQQGGPTAGQGARKDARTPRAMSSTVVDAVKALRASGMGMLAIARQLGIGTGTVQRIVSP